jgi:hypothetical protein
VRRTGREQEKGALPAVHGAEPHDHSENRAGFGAVALYCRRSGADSHLRRRFVQTQKAEIWRRLKTAFVLLGEAGKPFTAFRASCRPSIWLVRNRSSPKARKKELNSARQERYRRERSIHLQEFVLSGKPI